MYKFHPETKMLEFTPIPIKEIYSENPVSQTFISFEEFRTNGFLKVYENYLVPEINRRLAQRYLNSTSVPQVRVASSIRVGSSMDNVCKLGLQFIIENFSIPERDNKSHMSIGIIENPLFKLQDFDIPAIKSDNILYNKKGIPYVFNNIQEIDYGLTFDGKKLNIATSIYRLSVNTDGNNPEFNIRRNNGEKRFKLLDILSLMVLVDKDLEGKRQIERDMLGTQSITDVIFSISDIDSLYKLFTKKRFNVEDMTLMLVNKIRDYNLGFDFKRFYGEVRQLFNVKEIRKELNSLLSFNMAKGKLLFEDVVLDDMTIKADTLINDYIITVLNKHRVNKIYVRNDELDYTIGSNVLGIVYDGNRMTSFICGNVLPKGFPVLDELIALDSNLIGYAYLPKDYTFTQDVVLNFNDVTLTKERLNALFMLKGVEGFFTKKPRGEAYNSLREEIITNRHYKTESGSYVYHPSDVDMEESENLTRFDFLAIYSLILKLRKNKYQQYLRNPDISGFKRMIDVNEAFMKALRFSLERVGVAKSIADKICISNLTHDVAGIDSVYYEMLKFLTDHKYIQHTDFDNPVNYISSITKYNAGLINVESASDSMRGIAMHSFGRIDPFEFPASKKLGLTNNLTTGVVVKNGNLYVKYHPVIHNGQNIVDFSKIELLDIFDEEKYIIADIRDIKCDFETGIIDSSVSRVLALVPDMQSVDRISITYVDVSEVDFVTASVNQGISYASSTIPFIGSDDGARVSFATSMVKQSVGLVNPEIPDVCTTAFLDIPRKLQIYMKCSEWNGTVIKVTHNSVTITSSDDGRHYTIGVNISFVVLTSSVIIYKPVVKVNDIVKKGDIIFTSNYVIDGCMATGINALIGFIPNGLNYEDGVSCSRQFSNKLDSYGIYKEFVTLRDFVKKGSDIQAIEPNFVSNTRYIKTGDNIVYYRSKKDSSFIVDVKSKKLKGYLVSTEKDSDDDVGVTLKSVAINKLSNSDKVCNRHGNKGVTCSVFDNSKFYRLNNGMILDVVYNPCGVVSRMNLGQVMEAQCALAAHVLGIRIMCESYNSPSKEMIKELLSLAYDLANSDDFESVFQKYPSFPKEMWDWCLQNRENIQFYRNTFDKNGTAEVTNMKTGKKLLQRVTIGYNYIYKLVQEGDKKKHSRGGYLSSNYKRNDMCAPKGAANNGGQRIGYMEIDALIAHGVPNLIHEIFTESNDDYVARSRVIGKTLYPDSFNCLDGEENNVTMRRAWERFLAHLACMGICVENDDSDEVNTDIQKIYRWWSRHALLEYSPDDK